MKTIKDQKKFGKNKQRKNRNSKKGYALLKELRKSNRQSIAFIKDCLVHHRTLPEIISMRDLNKAIKQLKYTNF